MTRQRRGGPQYKPLKLHFPMKMNDGFYCIKGDHAFGLLIYICINTMVRFTVGSPQTIKLQLYLYYIFVLKRYKET